MSRTGPFVPIYDPGKRRGAVPTGVAVGEVPATPFSIIGRVAVNGPGKPAVGANHVFVPSGDDNAVYVFDITDPTDPTLVESVTNATTLNNAFFALLVGTVLYVSCTTGDRVTSIDVSDPTNISILHSLTNATTLDRPFGMVADGDYLYVAVLNTDRLTVVDKSNPSAMTVAGSVSDAALDGAFGVYKSGDTVLVAPRNETAIATVDVTTPSAPGSVTAYAHADLGEPRNFAVIGDTLYVAAPAGTPGSKLVEIDITTPSSPSYVAATALTNRPGYIAAVGTNLYTTPTASQTLTKSDATTSPPTEGTILSDADLLTAASEVYIDTNGTHLAVTNYYTDMLLIVAP